nr:SRPBCC domain-containing protein [uncultured Allomuricauda sp.]
MSDLKNRTLTVEKNFNAPLQLVWDAWTQSEHILKWWAPKGVDIKIIEHDFKIGGKWKYSGVMSDGKEYITEGTYTEIVKLKKIVTSADFKPMTENVEIQVYFEADGEKTKFTFSVIHATQEYCKQQEEMGFYNGWGSVLNRLEEFLNKTNK